MPSGENMRKEILPIALIAIVLISGCVNSANTFDRTTSVLKDLKIGNSYILTCHIPKATSINNYKSFESEEKGYNLYGLYLANKIGRTDFYIYELHSGKKSLEYLFGDSKEADKAKALEEWNKRQLSSKGYDRDFVTVQSTSMKEINGVKTDRVIRTTAKDQKGNQMIAESCWFLYSYAFWFMTSTWSDDYYDAWWSSDIILRYQY